MLFRNFHNLNQLLKDFNSFDDLFSENPNLKKNENVESGSDENGEWEKRTFVSDTGLFSYSFFTRKNNTKNVDRDLSKMKSELSLAVEKQDFELAVELRDKIKKFEENKEEINRLNTELSECIKNQNYEDAIKLRDKIKELR
jgi:excinuclease UvrABC helicase subunit UvrB